MEQERKKKGEVSEFKCHPTERAASSLVRWQGGAFLKWTNENRRPDSPL